MTTSLIDAAHEFTALAKKALEEGRVSEVFSLLEMAFTSALMTRSSRPISVKIWPQAALPRPLASSDHAIVHISSKGMVFYCAAEIIVRPICEFQRLSMLGEFFSGVAAMLPGDGAFECLVDLGDGDDLGDYRRIAYSSARRDTVLVPDPAFYVNDNYEAVRYFASHHAKPWRERKDILFWRGTAGGHRLRAPDPTPPADWSWVQRLHLCDACRKSAYAERIDVGLTSHHQIEEAFWRDEIERAGFMKPCVQKQIFCDYRYLIDIDGWANAWSLLDKLIMGATVFKVQSALGYRQWYYDRLQAWEHFVPVAADLADLDERIAWAIAAPDACERIAANAAALTRDIQLPAEMAAAQQAVFKVLVPILMPTVHAP